MKSRLLPFLLLPMASGIVAAAEGAFPSEMLVWRCWYDQQIHITCLIDSLPSSGGGMAIDPSSRLPAAVQKLRTHPEEFVHQFVHIPLHTQPYDPGLTVALAQAVVCGPRPDCRVNFSLGLPSPLEMEELLNRDFPVAGAAPPTAAPAGDP